MRAFHVAAAAAVSVSVLLTGCGEERRQATDVEKQGVLAVLSTGLHLRDAKQDSRLELPPGTETLINLVIDALCKASLTTMPVGDHVRETLTLNCKDGDFRGTYIREQDHYTFDLYAKTSLDVTYKGDVTANPSLVDGWMELKGLKDLWLTDVSVSDRIDFMGIQRDAQGCLVGGGMKVELHGHIPGKTVDVSTDALFGPNCGDVWVPK
ncbi:MAG TPA: hypothetical protein PKI49_03650 [Pseudomonadota bacterium]|jgi:hypothetical protein|nr:hypothetical protein [Pseudomonadota bacterium]HNI61169.1 hypothetical protein [Pseudomonadota bacterium]HNK44156.1 hypothetical protein [Pseudomonadota bacterium]HNN51467.1 hypothetical protein [Pseudomonadota bacterium]HNO67580.1 hypothetical protein [Pseudomonadota bacterium]